MNRLLAVLAALACLLGVSSAHAQNMCAPIAGFSATQDRTVDLPSGATVALDGRGCAAVPLGNDRAYLAAQGFTYQTVFPTTLSACAGDGVTNDTGCVVAAIATAVAAGTPLYFDGVHKYLVNLGAITLASNVDIEGMAPVGNDGIGNAQNCLSGLLANGTSGNMITVTAEKVIIRHLCIQENYPTSGAAIMLGGTDQQGTLLDGNTIFRPYDGISFGGTGGLVRNSTARDNTIRDPIRYGIAVGLGTTGGATAGITLTNNTIGCGDTSASYNGVGFAFFDGAVKWDGTTVGPNNCLIGSEIVPGASQNVNGEFTGVMGDSSGSHGGSNPMDLYIEPQSSTGAIQWLSFHNIWAAGVTNTDINVYIRNRYDALCQNISFNGLTAHGGVSGGETQAEIVAILGCAFITVTGSQIDAWTAGTVTNGILIDNIDGAVNNQPTQVAITGNHLGAEGGTTLTNGINLQLGSPSYINPDYVALTGNQIYATNPIVTNVQNNTYGILWTFANNEGVDDACPSVASATSVVLPGAYNCYHLTGTTTITTLNPAWINRKVTLIADSGLTLSDGGGLPGFCAVSTTVAAAGAALVEFTGNCWNVL